MSLVYIHLYSKPCLSPFLWSSLVYRLLEVYSLVEVISPLSHASITETYNLRYSTQNVEILCFLFCPFLLEAYWFKHLLTSFPYGIIGAFFPRFLGFYGFFI